MQEAAGAVAVAQPHRQALRQAALGGAERIGVPLGALTVVDRDEGRLSAHRQAHVAGLELPVDLVAQGDDGLPLIVGVGQRDAW